MERHRMHIFHKTIYYVIHKLLITLLITFLYLVVLLWTAFRNISFRSMISKAFPQMGILCRKKTDKLFITEEKKPSPFCFSQPCPEKLWITDIYKKV